MSPTVAIATASANVNLRMSLLPSRFNEHLLGREIGYPQDIPIQTIRYYDTPKAVS